MNGEVKIALGSVELGGELVIPEAARGVVLFAHGSGSGRRSPRNQFVARELHDEGIATLLFDLLTPEEEADVDEDANLRFDIPVLAGRLVAATDWLLAEPEVRALERGAGRGPAVGYFGASTGAAAALTAAAQRPREISAVVSRGGRPDLAAPHLARVRAPTLLIVGEADDIVLALNRRACQKLAGQNQLAVVADAGHLFEEPGALEEVARLAGGWFTRHFLGEPTGTGIGQDPLWR